MELAIKLNKVSLTKQLIREEDRIFTELYQLYARKVFNSVCRVLNDEASAEDVVQDAFCAAFEQRGCLRDPAKFEGWVKRIAFNKAINLLRKKKPVFVEENNLEITPADEDAEEQEIMHRTRIEDIKKAIAALPDGYRTIVTLHLFEDIPQEEIARMLSISHSTVRSQYHRAKKKILTMLKEKHDGKE